MISSELLNCFPYVYHYVGRLGCILDRQHWQINLCSLNCWSSGALGIHVPWNSLLGSSVFSPGQYSSVFRPPPPQMNAVLTTSLLVHCKQMCWIISIETVSDYLTWVWGQVSHHSPFEKCSLQLCDSYCSLQFKLKQSDWIARDGFGYWLVCCSLLNWLIVCCWVLIMTQTG